MASWLTKDAVYLLCFAVHVGLVSYLAYRIYCLTLHNSKLQKAIVDAHKLSAYTPTAKPDHNVCIETRDMYIETGGWREVLLAADGRLMMQTVGGVAQLWTLEEARRNLPEWEFRVVQGPDITTRVYMR